MSVYFWQYSACHAQMDAFGNDGELDESVTDCADLLHQHQASVFSTPTNADL